MTPVSVVVMAERWYDARTVAFRAFICDEEFFSCEEVDIPHAKDGTETPIFEVTWTGTDARSRMPNRTMVVRQLEGKPLPNVERNHEDDHGKNSRPRTRT